MSGSLSALEQWPHVMMNTYGIPQVELVSGSGAQVTDSSGRTYIDMLAGIAVNSLGRLSRQCRRRLRSWGMCPICLPRNLLCTLGRS